MFQLVTKDNWKNVDLCSFCTVLVLRMANRKWNETKQQLGTAESGNMLGCCLNSFLFLWAILSTSTVVLGPYHEAKILA